MAISPNDTFTSGQILTAQECNQFPFGVQVYDTETATSSSFSTVVTVCSGTMTAIANRLYRMTYFEPQLIGNALMAAQMKILDGATQLQMSYIYVPAQETNGIITVVTTLSAGAHTINATMVRASPNTLTATRSAGAPAFLIVEDIGPT